MITLVEAGNRVIGQTAMIEPAVASRRYGSSFHWLARGALQLLTVPQSYLACTDAETKFYGNLDIDTLGGAGFASQRTTGEDRQWDLSAYNAIELCIGSADDKQYTFILKDELFATQLTKCTRASNDLLRI